jgi:cell division protein ZapE
MAKVLERYQGLVVAGELKPDADQENAAKLLSELQTKIEETPDRGSVLWRVFGKKPQPVRGVYMWGGVGRGKSMLMDLFHQSVAIHAKRRAHFHEFMMDIHARLNAERKKEQGDPVMAVVEALASEVRLLSFDEMVVNNSADAMIMGRLFTGLINAGVTIVTTSNRPPDDLYKDGLNREHFQPFISLVKDRLDVLNLNGPTDYRLERLGDGDTWFVPNGTEATARLSEAFFRLTDYPPSDKAHVPTEDIRLPGGRNLHVPKSLKGVAVFSFKRLCAEARGASDYLTIARHFHTVIMVGIPKLSPANRNEAARFVTLIDTLYEYRVKFLASAEAHPFELYQSGDGSFEFERTASRLMEMQSKEYLAQGHGPQDRPQQ